MNFSRNQTESIIEMKKLKKSGFLFPIRSVTEDFMQVILLLFD